jgi:hypothetical protein
LAAGADVFLLGVAVKSTSSTSSITAIGALSPLRGPIFVMRV